MTSLDKRKSMEWWAAAVAAYAAILTVDLAVPGAVAVAVLHVGPVMLGLRFPRTRDVWALAAVSVALILLGGLAHGPGPEDPSPWFAHANRGIALGSVLACATLVWLNRTWGESLDQRTRELEDLRRALDQAAIVVVTDPRGLILDVNETFCLISGYAREEIVGKTHRMLRSGVHPKAFMADLWDTIKAKQIWRGEICNRAKDGRLYWVDTTIVPILGADGEVDRFLAIRFDITARKEAQARLVAQEGLARLGEMAAVVAHEVKNPLAGMKSALQVIGRRLPEDSMDRRVVHDILARIDSLHASLQDMLIFARPPEPRFAPVRVQDMARACLILAERDPLSEHVDLDVSGDDVEVVADHALCEEALLNLVLNAAQAMEGRGRVQIRCEARPTEVLLHVDDTGPGVPEEVRERIFQPFFTTRTRGTGLGLSIVQQVASRHGGALRLTRTGPEGSTFTLVLPRFRESALRIVGETPAPVEASPPSNG